MKAKYILVVLCIFWTALYITQAYNSAPDLMKISPNDYDTIRVENIDLELPLDKLIFSGRVEVTKFCTLLKKAKSIDFDSINVKASTGYCKIYMVAKKNPFNFYYIQTSFSGGIIQMDNEFYRNDSLIIFLRTASTAAINSKKTNL